MKRKLDTIIYELSGYDVEHVIDNNTDYDQFDDGEEFNKLMSYLYARFNMDEWESELISYINEYVILDNNQ